MHALTHLTRDEKPQQTRRPAAPQRSLADARGYGVSGATGAALDAYEQALAAFQSWHSGAEVPLGAALDEAPGFVMAHAMQAWMRLCSRDPHSAQRARPVLARTERLPANERERLHLAAIGAAIADEYSLARDLLGDLLRTFPRDALALQVAHVFDYLTGDTIGMRARVESVLPAWSGSAPGYHAVLAMHAFSLEECGQYAAAEQRARAALALDPLDARAHHVMAHVFEMTDRPAEGARWMGAHVARWGGGTVVATHCWWHVALFHLAQGRLDAALACYDGRIRAGRSAAIGDLIDASALLWRIMLGGGACGARWSELADAWAPHIDDRYCSFTDLHAMLAFVGARDWERAQRLVRTLTDGESAATRHGATTRLLGLPACRALLAFGRGNDTLALTLLAGLPALAHRLGGSHAQRDVLNLTMLHALGHVRRPGPRDRACARERTLPVTRA